MITLYAFGPAFGLPDPSPFVTKAEVLLKLSRLPYKVDTGGFRKAPKGKLPYIDDDGERIADSTFIRWHLEKRHGIAFDAGLTAEQRATAWAFEKMLEDHFYWALVDFRWVDDANFRAGPAAFFRGVPAPARPFVIAMVRRSVRRNLRGQGLGRHGRGEIEALGIRSVDAVADYLGDKAFFMGEEPRGIDATVFAFMAGTLSPAFRSPIRDAAARRDNLTAYVRRMAARFYPDLPALAGEATVRA